VSDYLLFALAFFSSALTPGADTMLILSRAISDRKLAIAAAAGITTGKVLMVTLAYFGLAAALSASEELFTVVKVLGAGFLVYKAFSTWNRKTLETKVSGTGDFFGALAIGFSNPQPLAFYISTMPLVVASTQLPVLLLIVVFGFAIVSAIYIGLAQKLSAWLNVSQNLSKVNRVLAAVFLVLAVIVITR
jgi:threonine/homoserine/homoserine lactone efflux protein